MITIENLRVPPHSVEAEQSVLGGLLLDNLAWDRAAELLGEGDFYRYEHRLIFGAIAALVAATRPADVVTVFERLQASGKAADAGGLSYLNALAQSVPSAANMRRYAEIVRERSILRELIAAGDEIATTAFNREARPVGDIVDEAERKILAVGEATARGRDGFRDAAELVTELLDEVQRRADARTDELTGVRTGYHELDAMTAGLQRGDLVVLAARPSMGKTALALNIAENVAVKEELPVLVFSMEMGASQLTRRLAASRARINQQDLRAARLDDAGWSRLADAAEVIARAPLAIDATPGLSAAELRARARRQARKHGGPLGLIVIDYLQLMRGGAGSEDTRAAELGEISRSLKALAMEMDCPVLALSQLNRGVENRNEKRPVMSDLRDSGAIEQDADLIAFIYRDDYYNKDSKEPGIAELIVAKQRNGPLGTVKLAFLKPLTKFENLGP